jgi:hypothetical protein
LEVNIGILIYLFLIEKYFFIDKTGHKKEFKIKDSAKFQEICKECKPDEHLSLQMRLPHEIFQKFLTFINGCDPYAKIKGNQFYKNKVYLIPEFKEDMHFNQIYSDSYVLIQSTLELRYIDEYGKTKKIKADETKIKNLIDTLISAIDMSKHKTTVPIQELSTEVQNPLNQLWELIKEKEQKYACEDYYDVRKHEPGVIFHMSPAYTNHHCQLSKEIVHKDKEFYMKILSALSKHGFFNLYRQTAFAHTGGNNHEKKRTKNGIDKLTDLSYVKILYDSLMPIRNNGP